MSRIAYFRSGKINRFYKRINEIAKKENKNTFLMLCDFAYCSFKYGSGLTDYINYEFYRKNHNERKEYVTILDGDKFYELLSPAKYKLYFTNKPNFLNNFKKYIDRDYCTFEMGFAKFNNFLDKNNEFMHKPVDGLGGHDVEKIKTSDISNRKEFFNKLKETNSFVEGYIIQNKEVAKFSPTSVNTIRIMTYANNNKSHIFYAAMRIGNGTSSVDNFHQGGMGVAVNIKTGKLTGRAINKLGEEFDIHPVTKVKFDGFTIPHWDYIVKMVEEAALVNQNIHVVGWDVAVTEDGATFVEGNRRPGWDLVQELDHRGSKFRMREIINEYRKDEREKNEK